MKCIVTAGPTYEEMDQVRRLTNFSTGRLGSELASYLVEHGHDVVLLLGHYSTWRGKQKAQTIRGFTTTENLSSQLEDLASPEVRAVFHAAAVSDFTFGKILTRTPTGELEEVHSSKVSTRSGTLLAELIPTPKLIGRLRGWFPMAKIVGWKYEVEGTKDDALVKARRQVAENHIDACVANGHAYGRGYGLVDTSSVLHCSEGAALFQALEEFAKQA